MLRRLSAVLASLLLAACATAPAPHDAVAPVSVGIIAINDFHGNLEPPKASVAAPDGKGGTVRVPAGGAAWLASAIGRVRADYRYSVTVAAGDLIGASPLVSSYYLDEPAIGVLNRVGLDYAAVGNHEFDRGRAELLRIQNGGCARTTRRVPCRLERYAGARFRYLAATTLTESGWPLFPATAIRRFGAGRRKVTVGFVGLTLRGTPALVVPEGVAGLRFGDEAEAINREVPRLKARGADAVVVLIHEGGRTADPQDPDGCNALSGDILPIVAKLDPRVDAVISGHTHWPYVCELARPDGGPLLLTSAGHYGRVVTDLRIDIDPAGRRVVAKRARNLIVQSPGYQTAREAAPNTDLFRRFEPDSRIAAYVARYAGAIAPVASRPVGKLAGPAARDSGPQPFAGGSLGSLVADAQLAATRSAGAQIALTNPFGLRAPLNPGAGGAVSYGDIYAVQPFDNPLLTQTMTGAELHAALEQCLDAEQPEQLLAVSAGFAYTFDRSRPIGQRIVAMTLDGAPIPDDADYRVTTNLFLATGGDGFSAFTRRRDQTGGAIDLEALEAWLAGETPRAVPDDVRVIDRTGS